MPDTTPEDLYALLQVHPAAEPNTIDCVYRNMTMRLSSMAKKANDPTLPDRIKAAYDILKDGEKRAEYDKLRAESEGIAVPPAADPGPSGTVAPAKAPSGKTDKSKSSLAEIAATKAFERHKRQAVLDVLYDKILVSPHNPGINIRQIEALISIPKEDLDFALWYLTESGWVKPMDNGRFALTFLGVNAAEKYEDQMAAK